MHWIAVVPKQHESAHDTRGDAIKQLTILFRSQSSQFQIALQSQLRLSKGASVAYDTELEEIAKVLPCNCGSKQKHRS